MRAFFNRLKDVEQDDNDSEPISEGGTQKDNDDDSDEYRTTALRQFFKECCPHIIEIYDINPYEDPAFIFVKIRELKPGPFYQKWCNPEICMVIFSSEESGMFLLICIALFCLTVEMY